MNLKNTFIPPGVKITRYAPSDRQAPSLRRLRQREERCIAETGMTMVEQARDQREAARQIDENRKRVRELVREMQLALERNEIEKLLNVAR